MRWSSRPRQCAKASAAKAHRPRRRQVGVPIRHKHVLPISRQNVDVRLAGKEYEVPSELTVALGEAAQAKAANSST